MFDKLTVNPGHTTHHHTHVEMVDPSVEKGARHLDEVQAEAMKRITKMMLLDVPGISVQVVAYEMQRRFADDSVDHFIAFRLNGNDYTVRLNHEERKKPEAIAAKVVEAISIELMRQVAGQMARAMTPIDRGAR